MNLQKILDFLIQSSNEDALSSYASVFNGEPLNTEVKFYPHARKGVCETTTIEEWLTKNTVEDGILVLPDNWEVQIKGGEYSHKDWQYSTWVTHVELCIGAKLQDFCTQMGITEEDIFG